MTYQYNTVNDGGDVGGAHQLKVYVYPDDSNDDSICDDTAVPGLIDACKQAYNSSSVIDYWKVAITYDHPNVWDSTDDRSDALNDFEARLNDQTSVPKGSHLLIEGDGVGGIADGGDVCQNERSAWNDWSPAVYGTDGDSGSYLQAIAIQEAFHNFIDKCVSGVDSQISGDCGEHDLGQVTYFGNVTPLLASYEHDSDCYNSGDCRTGEPVQDYVTDITSCTIDALDSTATQHV